MRLLERSDTGELRLTEVPLGHDAPFYAILSHTWDAAEEVTFKEFKELTDGADKSKGGLSKIQFCGDQAFRDGLRYCWVDTCCIDKSSSAELQEAINRMFSWYRDAAKCYVHLADVSKSTPEANEGWKQAFQKSRWFTRGWTLQELIAPTSVEFFSKEGTFLGNKRSLEEQIHEITGIPIKALRGDYLSHFSVSERMAWTKKRDTTRQEDKAYSLFGIFDVQIPLLYGEGREKALKRLYEEIKKAANDENDELPPTANDTAFDFPSKEHNATSSPHRKGRPGKRGENDGLPRSAAENQRRKRQRRLIRLPVGRENPSSNSGGSLNKEKAELRKELIHLLYFDRVGERLLTLKKAYDKTCQWILDKEQYRVWMDAENLQNHHGFFWIKGKPGVGKSTLIKFLDTKAKDATRLDPNGLVVSFFFNARGEHLEKSTVGLYRSLLWQLFERAEDLQVVLDDFGTGVRRILGRNGWQLEILKETLADAVKRLGHRRLQFYIDALDECDDDDVADMITFFEEIGEIALQANVHLRICFSSRHYPAVSIQWGEQIVLEDEERHHDDIAQYIKSKLKLESSRQADGVRTKLLEKSAGIFLWVALVIPMLNEASAQGRVEELQKCLDGIPPGLDDLLEMILTRDREHMDELRLCIQWILFAVRPLKPEEYFIAIRNPDAAEMVRWWDSGSISAQTMSQFVYSSSKGLAEVIKSQESSDSVQFIHESVRDFFLINNGRRILWPGLDGRFDAYSHEVLKTRCLAELNSTIRSDRLTKLWQVMTRLLREVSSQFTIDFTIDLSTYASAFPNSSSQWDPELQFKARNSFLFLKYAVNYVLIHTDAAEGGGINQAGFIQNFELADWIKVNNILEYHRTRRYNQNTSLLYIFAAYNLANLIRNHTSNLLCFEVQDAPYGAPIFAALACRSGEATQAFLEVQMENHQATSSLRDKYEGFCQASYDWNTFWDNFIFSPQRGVLSHLAERASEVVTLTFLLTSGSGDTNSTDELGRAPMSCAAARGHEAVVRQLLTMDANIETTDKAGRTPLSWASAGGHKAVARLLLQTGANVESTDEAGRTPLSWAAGFKHEAIVKLLLTTDRVDTNCSDRNGRTPLIWAAKTVSAGDSHAMQVYQNTQMLLERRRVEVKEPLMPGLIFKPTMGISFAPPVPAGTDASVIIEMLLEEGADIDSMDNDGRTALSWAAEEGHTNIVRLLLNNGANAMSPDKIGRTPLSWAVETGTDASVIIKMLLEKGADIDSMNKDGRTALSWAVEKGHINTVRLLLENGTDIESMDKDGRTALSWAAEEGHTNTVRLLLQNGANTMSPDKNGRTPLSWAVETGINASIIIIKMLFERCADIESMNKDGRTALSWAAEKGHTNAVHILIEKGADIESKDKDGRTALPWAAEKGHTNAVRLLLKNGADIESMNKDGRTALLWAAGKGHTNAVRLLLENGADIESMDKDGRTALSWAAKEGHTSTVRVLLENGANAMSPDKIGRTPLSWTFEKSDDSWPFS